MTPLPVMRHWSEVCVNQPHDRLFRALMSHPETAGAFLREYLPEKIAALLSVKNPELEDGTFVSQELALYYSDRIFRAELISGKLICFYILLEHKSYLDHHVALQLGRGIMGINQHKHIWWQEGEQEGIKEGELTGKIDMLLDLLQERFGSVPDWVGAKLATADLNTLKVWSKRIFGADKIEQIFQ